MIKFFYFLCSLFILSGCTLFFGERNEDIFTTNNITPTKVPEALYCPKKQSITVLSETKSAGQDFIKFIKKVESNHSLSFIDKTILWTLIQFNLRPDKSSPQAKLQILLTINGKESFYNGQVSNKGPATFYTLKRLLKKYNSRYSLQSLASFIDKYYLNSFYVSNTFENFLQIHKDSIAQNPVLKKIYMRGDETLRENERIPKLNYTSLFKNVKRNKNFKLISKLFKINQNTLLETKCNFDINVYEKSWYHIAPQKLQAHTFGLQEGKNRFMAMSSLSFSKLEVYQKTHLFSGSSEMRSGAICSFKHKKWNDYHLWLFSSESRDPGQHLFHLLEYGPEGVTKTEDLSTMINFSRHLFLKNPMRLIIESRKSQEAQIQELLKLNIPLYNSKSLGKIWGFINFDNNAHFVIDPRHEGSLTCN